MIEAPEKYIQQFAQAGANIITVHVEVCPHLHRVVESIKELGVKAGVSLNPSTPLTTVDEVLSTLDLVLLMSVNPGFGGQQFIESTVGKIVRLRHRLDELGLAAELEVDGGINAEIAPRVAKAGARVLVAGAAVFNKKESVSQALGRIRENLRKLENGWKEVSR
jgi:ribulose-phosphate 3-epimerase